jgi:hypothetical protein
MANGLVGAHREELKDKQLLSLRTELRSYRLNGSGMNKIVRSRSAIPWSIKRNRVRRVYLRVNRHLALALVFARPNTSSPRALRSSSGPIFQ